MRYGFYPGCTLHSTATEFGSSMEMTCAALGIELVEIPDWNCCGASSAHSLNHTLALALPTRDLVQAQQLGLTDIAIPCVACYARMVTADYTLRNDAAFRAEMETALGFTYEGRVRPRHLLDILANDFTSEELVGQVTRPLQGLRVVSYYGCLLVRPPELTGRWDDPEQPQTMDRLVELLGAEAVPWSYKVDCCGASLTLNRSDVVVHLVDRLVQAAHEAGANAIVNACPMCMANVDGRQRFRGGPGRPGPTYVPMPVFYITELLALAFGRPLAKVLGKHAIDPRPLLKGLNLV